MAERSYQEQRDEIFAPVRARAQELIDAIDQIEPERRASYRAMREAAERILNTTKETKT